MKTLSRAHRYTISEHLRGNSGTRCWARSRFLVPVAQAWLGRLWKVLVLLGAPGWVSQGRERRGREGDGRKKRRQARSPCHSCPGPAPGAGGHRGRGQRPTFCTNPGAGLVVPSRGPASRSAPSGGPWVLQRIQPQLSRSRKFYPVAEAVSLVVMRLDI